MRVLKKNHEMAGSGTHLYVENLSTALSGMDRAPKYGVAKKGDLRFCKRM